MDNLPINTPSQITFRAWPKMIFTWPIALLALGTGGAHLLWPQHGIVLSWFFLGAFLMVTLILSFEFSRLISLTLFFALISGLATTVILNHAHPFVTPVMTWMLKQNLKVSPEFYFALGGVYLFVLFQIFLSTRFHYWQLTPNELIHKKGFLGGTERFSTSGLKVEKEITDIFEYFLGGAGRIIVFVPNNQRPIVLNNVLRMNEVEKAAEAILNAPMVRIEPGPPPPLPPMGMGIPPGPPNVAQPPMPPAPGAPVSEPLTPQALQQINMQANRGDL